MKRNQTIYRLVYTGLFSALIFIGTFIFKVPTGIGYIHLGDGFIYIAAMMLPLPYAMVAAAIGGGLADLIAGYAIWIPATVVIKALSPLLFSSMVRKLLCFRNIMAMAFGAFVNIVGYYLYGSLIQGNFIACLAEIPLNFVQEGAACVFFVAVAISFDLAPRLRSIISRQTLNQTDVFVDEKAKLKK